MVTERATMPGRGGNIYAELENELEGQIKSDDETGGELQSINGFDTSFAGKIPSEVLEQISGDRRLRRALASNQKNGMGEDLVMAIGADRYVDILKSKVYGKQMKNDLDAGIAELLKSRDPDDVVVAKVALAAQDAMESGERYKAPKSFLRIAELEPGDTFTIWGKKTVMGQNELGELVGVGGALDGVPVYEGMQPIPVDGEVRKGKAPAVVSAEQSDSYNLGVETTDDIPFAPRGNNKPVNTKTANRSQLAAILKEFDVPATGSNESLRERAEFLTANPRDWTREQFNKFAYLLKIHQDVNGTH
jgi:hypothetical protein